MIRRNPMFLCASLILFFGCQNGEETEAIKRPTVAGIQKTVEQYGYSDIAVETQLLLTYSILDGWTSDWGNAAPPWPAAGSNWVFGSVLSDESYKGSEPGDQLEMQQLEIYQWLPTNVYFDVKFKTLYEGITRADATLLLLEEVEMEPSNTAEIEAEARFLRAHYYFEAWKMWGYIPYYLKDEISAGYSQIDPVPYLIEDFQFAKDNLPSEQQAIGRATSGAAQAYLGKLYLYNHQFAEAKSEFEEIVLSGRYSLEPCFYNISSTQFENGSEMLFTIQATTNDGTSEGENGNFGDRMTYPHGGSPFGCCGFNQPSQNLVNSYKVDASGLPLTDFNSSDLNVASDFVDPRLDWTVGRDGVPFLNWGTHDPTWIRNRDWAGPFSPKKLVHRNGEQQMSGGWSSSQLNPVNRPVIRYADVLLMLAECEVELGNLEQARSLVNQVRARAANCAIGPNGDPVELANSSITWAQYNIAQYTSAWTDQSIARRAVRMERKLELALEGHRLFDLRRWHGYDFDFFDYINDEYLAVEEEKRLYLQSAQPIDYRYIHFPLPNAQVRRLGLVQNAGY